MEGQGALHEAIEYPVRDGKPMGETDRHRDELKDYAVNVLLDHFEGRPSIYVSGNNFVYYQQGDPKAVVSPDTYVVKGVEQRQRDTFMLWKEEGHKPCFVLEITSKSSRREDLGAKMSRYRDDLEVPEYFLFDPFGEWIKERLRGFVLECGVYQAIQPGPSGRLPSGELGLELAAVGGHLRFFSPGADEALLTRAEGREKERQRADQECQRAEEERQRAEEERQRADQAEQEAAKLRAELDRLRGQD